MARKPTTSRAVIEALLNKGFNQAEIAKILRLSKAGVNYHLRYAEGEPPETLMERLKKSLPWAITGDMVRAAPYRRMLYHLEYRETGGKNMSAEKLRKLRGFYEKLTDFRVVVRYDPDIQPCPGQKFGGFEYVPRTESDDALILRADNNTTLSADSREIWRIPAREDWPE